MFFCASTASAAKNESVNGTQLPSRAKGRSVYPKLGLVALLVIAVDQITKSLALEHLADGPRDVIEGILTFRLTFNSGGAFGILQGFPAFFLIATAVAGVAILIWVRHLDEPGWTVPLGLVLGGGLGNLIDRVLRDTPGVVDFVDLHVWPVWNVADACIVTGVGVILFLGFRSERREGEPPPEQEA